MDINNDEEFENFLKEFKKDSDRTEKKTLDFFLSKSKSEMKLEMISWDIDLLEYLSNSALIKENYEICAAIVEVLEERKNQNDSLLKIIE